MFCIKRDFFKHKTEKTSDKIRRFGVMTIPFYVKCFETKKIGIFRARLIAFLSVEFLKIFWTVKHIVPFVVPVDEKKFMRPNVRYRKKTRKHKIANGEETAFFRLLNDRQDKFHKLQKL